MIILYLWYHFQYQIIMREYAKKPESQSRTLDSNPRTSKQAPIDVILQRYKERNIQRYAEDEELIQAKLETAQREKIDEDELLQGKFESVPTSEQKSMQREEKPNNTRLPDNLKTGIENLSGYSMDDVQVHYNSSKPAQLQALAYAQGTNIHVAPGQEQHLPHEAWHVVQQKQGRVQPIVQLHGVNVNDNEGLEKEADVMGIRALNPQTANRQAIQLKSDNSKTHNTTIQCALVIGKTTIDDNRINKKGSYKTKLNKIISTESRKAHLQPQQVRVELSHMAISTIDTFVFPTKREAVDAAIGRITGIATAETTLGDEMRKHEALNKFPQSKIWMMLMDGKYHATRGKYGFENEKGYMSALMSAFTNMLQNLTDELTVDSYAYLHDLAVNGVYNRNGTPMDKGYRNNQTEAEGFGVDNDTWSSDGYDELSEKYRNRNTKKQSSSVGWALALDPKGMVGPSVETKIMKIKPLAQTQCKRFAGVVINDYHEELRRAETEEDKLRAIARCCQDLDQLHLFVDGNIRTVTFLLLNKLLLQNNLSPVIMEEPNVFDCKSIAELIDAIKAGQKKFESFRD